MKRDLFAYPGHRTRGTPRDWVAAGRIERGTINLMIGMEGSGKSALANEIARCVAIGEPLFGCPVKPGAVVIIAAERYSETDRRLEAALVDCDPVPPLKITGAVRDLHGNHLLAREVAEQALAFANERGEPLQLVVIDTLAAVMGDGDENQSREATRLWRSFEIIRDMTGAAVIVLHHSKRGERRARGAQVFEASADMVILVERKAGDLRSARIIKSNSTPEGLTMRFRLEAVERGEDPESGVATTVVLARQFEAGAVPAPSPTLRGDAANALRALLEILDVTGSASLADWRAAAMAAFGDRTEGALRVAWNGVRKKLTAEGVVMVEGDRVSVSNPLEWRKRMSGANAPHALANRVSAGPPLGGSANAANGGQARRAGAA